MALREFAARMTAWGYVRGARHGLRLKTPEVENTVVGGILKSAAILRLLLKTPKVSTREICDVLDEKHIGLPWDELRKKEGNWANCWKKANVKMAISDARRAAKPLAERERWLRLIKRTEPEFRERQKREPLANAEREPGPIKVKMKGGSDCDGWNKARYVSFCADWDLRWAGSPRNKRTAAGFDTTELKFSVPKHGQCSWCRRSPRGTAPGETFETQCLPFACGHIPQPSRPWPAIDA